MSDSATLIPPVSARDHVEGHDDAPVTLVEYADYQCPYCGEAHPAIKRLQKSLGKKLRFVFRNFPLTHAHPYALLAAQAAEAAALQGKFWQMHDVIFENQEQLEPEVLPAWAHKIGLDVNQFPQAVSEGRVAKRIEEDYTSGVESGVDGTPSFFINGTRYEGEDDYDSLHAALLDAADSRTQTLRTKIATTLRTMSKPVIWTVDDDPDVLRAVERDLRRHYGDRYRVISADSGASALESTKQLKLRNESVALFLVDQRMPRMSGVEFLEKAIELYPDAKRALLTAYADTDAAIRAINNAHIDHYLMKPWDPPEERLYGVVDDMLDDWQSSYRPEFQGVRVVGHQWSPQSTEIRDFLGRNFVPHQWLNVETDEDAKQLLTTAGVQCSSLPIVVFPDGSFLSKPPAAEVARKLGLKTKAEFPFYDLVVVGAGPSGLAAAVYGAADGLHTLLIEREAPGGQAGRSSRIENYLGFPMGLSGNDLARRAVAQARRFGVEILTPQEVCGVRVEGPTRVLKLSDGGEVGCRALLIASGIAFRKLDVPGLERLSGAGVYYYAPMSAAFSYRDGNIYIVGGANSAGQAVMYFSKFARQVTMLVRGGSLSDSMSQYLENQIAATKNIEVRLNSSVIAVEGADHCETVTIQNNKTRETEKVSASALLIYAGAVPHTDWLAGIVERDAQGYVISGQHLMLEGKRPTGWTADRDPFYLETSVPGIFVAGDVRHRSAKGVTSGVGEGAMAVKLVHQYLGLL